MTYEANEYNLGVKVGDKIRLTGTGWDGYRDSFPAQGEEVAVTRIDADGDLVFETSAGLESYASNNPELIHRSFELVTPEPATAPGGWVTRPEPTLPEPDAKPGDVVELAGGNEVDFKAVLTTTGEWMISMKHTSDTFCTWDSLTQERYAWRWIVRNGEHIEHDA